MKGLAGTLASRLSAFSYQSLIPAGAGTPRYENPELWLGTANWHGASCLASPPPQRGTSPSPRVVFDRTTFPHPHPFWIPAFAGMEDPGDSWDTASLLKRRNVVFIAIAHAGRGRHTKV